MKSQNLPGSFWALVDRTDADGCWPWLGYRQKGTGYGSCTIDGARKLAHRVAYELEVGPIPVGLFIDHVCHSNDLSCEGGQCAHRGCVNPAHLEPVTFAENVRRGRCTGQTHCVNGHEYTPENTYTSPQGHRQCRECMRERSRTYGAAWQKARYQDPEFRARRAAYAAERHRRLRQMRPPVVLNADKTHCPKGHPYDEANTRIYRGSRFCRACKRMEVRT